MKKKRKMVVQRLLKHRASKMQWFSLAGMLHLLTAWTRPQRIIREYARTQHKKWKLQPWKSCVITWTWQFYHSRLQSVVCSPLESLKKMSGCEIITIHLFLDELFRRCRGTRFRFVSNFGWFLGGLVCSVFCIGFSVLLINWVDDAPFLRDHLPPRRSLFPVDS